MTPSALTALFLPICLIALLISLCHISTFSSKSYDLALCALNYSLIHYSFISAMSLRFLTTLTSLHSIRPLFASYQSQILAIGPLIKFSIPSYYEYRVYLLTALCHFFGFCLWFFCIISFSKKSFAISKKVSLVSSGVHSTSLVSSYSIRASIDLGLYFFILMPLSCFHFNASITSSSPLALTILQSRIIESFLICL